MIVVPSKPSSDLTRRGEEVGALVGVRSAYRAARTHGCGRREGSFQRGSMAFGERAG